MQQLTVVYCSGHKTFHSEGSFLFVSDFFCWLVVFLFGLVCFPKYISTLGPMRYFTLISKLALVMQLFN